jgi:hypothetical protein
VSVDGGARPRIKTKAEVAQPRIESICVPGRQVGGVLDARRERLARGGQGTPSCACVPAARGAAPGVDRLAP